MVVNKTIKYHWDTFIISVFSTYPSFNMYSIFHQQKTCLREIVIFFIRVVLLCCSKGCCCSVYFFPHLQWSSNLLLWYSDSCTTECCGDVDWTLIKVVIWRNYRAFHRFGQAKFPDGGSVLGLSQFSILTQPPLWIKLSLKVVKMDSKIIILLR